MAEASETLPPAGAAAMDIPPAAAPSPPQKRAAAEEPLSGEKAPKLQHTGPQEEAAAEDEAPGVDEVADGDAAELPEDGEQHLDLAALAEVARRTWTSGSAGSGAAAAAPEGLGACSFAVLPWRALPNGRLPFQLLAAALEIGCNERGPRALRSLTHVFLWVIQQSSDARGDLNALLNTLLAQPCPHPQIAGAVGAAFALKTSTGAPMTAYQALNNMVSPEELPDRALQERRSQRTLFGSKGLAASEVAAAVAAQPANHSKTALAAIEKRLAQLLIKSSSEHREVWHLVRIFQGSSNLSCATVLRALAYAFHFLRAGAEMQVDCAARFDLAVFRAWAVRGAEPGWLVDQLLPLEGESPPVVEALESATVPLCGFGVRPMKAEEADSAEEALEKLGEVGAMRVEWLLDGQRAQIHVRKDGAEVQVFVGHSPCREIEEEVASILKGNLRSVGDAILEVMLMRPVKRPAGNQDDGAEGNDARLQGNQDEGATGEAAKAKPFGAASARGKGESSSAREGDREGPEPDRERVHGVVVFDVLMFEGRPLARLPLRARRAQLEAAVVESGRLRLAQGVDCEAGALGLAAVKAELVKACGAFCLARDLDEKACSRACGVVLKALDGQRAEYFPGVRAPLWQAITQPPAIEGPEAEELLFKILSETERAALASPDEFLFCVVSARRTKTEEGVQDILTVQRHFQDAGVSPRWYVDKESLEEYLGLGLDAVVGGKLIPARNLALDDAEKLGKVCVQVSDDIEKWQYIKQQECFTSRPSSFAEANAAGATAERLQVSPVAAARFILAKMRCADEEPKPQLGGIYPLSNLGQCLKGLPYSRRNFIIGDFFIVDKSRCRFDTRMTLKEDYDLTCAHLQAHGSVMRCNRFVLFAKHETNAGGACSVRDSQGERERENIRILRQKYPGAFFDNPRRPNQVVLSWAAHLRWLREHGKVPMETAQASSTPESGPKKDASRKKQTLTLMEDRSVAKLPKDASGLGARAGTIPKTRQPPTLMEKDKDSMKQLGRTTENTRISYRPDAKTAISHPKSYGRYQAYAKAKTFKEAMDLGASSADINFDFKSGFIALLGGPMREGPPESGDCTNRWDRLIRSWHNTVASHEVLANTPDGDEATPSTHSRPEAGAIGSVAAETEARDQETNLAPFAGESESSELVQSTLESALSGARSATARSEAGKKMPLSGGSVPPLAKAPRLSGRSDALFNMMRANAKPAEAVAPVAASRAPSVSASGGGSREGRGAREGTTDASKAQEVLKKNALQQLVQCTEETVIKYTPGAKTVSNYPHSYERYEAYSKATTLKEALELGAIPGDIMFDFQRGYCTLAGGTTRDGPPPVKTLKSHKGEAFSRVDKLTRTWQRLLEQM